jgi:hypothetical protein
VKDGFDTRLNIRRSDASFIPAFDKSGRDATFRLLYVTGQRENFPFDRKSSTSQSPADVQWKPE